jgi:hypothetical protein
MGVEREVVGVQPLGGLIVVAVLEQDCAEDGALRLGACGQAAVKCQVRKGSYAGVVSSV